MPEQPLSFLNAELTAGKFVDGVVSLKKRSCFEGTAMWRKEAEFEGEVDNKEGWQEASNKENRRPNALGAARSRLNVDERTHTRAGSLAADEASSGGEGAAARARRSEPGPGSCDAGARFLPKKKAAWLSALVAETPPRPAPQPGPKIMLQNQFIADSTTPGRPGNKAWSALLPVPDMFTLPPRDSPSDSVGAPLIIAPSGDRLANSSTSSARCSSVSDAATSASSPSSMLSSHRDMSGDATRTPSSSGLSDSAARKWLTSSRGDWYSSSARAKVAASSMGFSPMPINELLSLPVPPLFLAVDEQERRRSTRHEYPGSHDVTRENADVQDVESESPLVPTQLDLPLRYQLPTPEDAGRFRNDFALRPDTIWRGPTAATPREPNDAPSADASHSTIAADARDSHNDFAAAHSAQSVSPAPELIPQNLCAMPRVLAHIGAQPRAVPHAHRPSPSQLADERDVAQSQRASEQLSASEIVMGCLRLNAPPSLGFLLGGNAGALRTDVSTPALARKAAAADNGADMHVHVVLGDWDTLEGKRRKSERGAR